jgi:catechol 2,3-dioxygenase-like lactoylglutathione lyase family enzyme
LLELYRYERRIVLPIEIDGLNHCAISVPNLEESITWYAEKFGFTAIDRSKIPGVNIKVAHMQGGGFILEIFEAEGAALLPEDRRYPNRDLMTHGHKHFSVAVKDARKASKELEAMGVEIAMVAEVDGTYGVFIRDNSGNLIEVFQEQN